MQVRFDFLDYILINNQSLVLGHLIKALSKTINCEQCLNACYQYDSEPLKFYDDWSLGKNNDDGVYPSEDVLKICVAVEKEIRFYLQNTKVLQKSIETINNIIISMVFRKLNMSEMFFEINQHSRESSLVGQITTHQIKLSKEIITLYLLLRKKEIIKKKNENSRTMIRQNLGPLMNLMHQ